MLDLSFSKGKILFSLYSIVNKKAVKVTRRLKTYYYNYSFDSRVKERQEGSHRDQQLKANAPMCCAH